MSSFRNAGIGRLFFIAGATALGAAGFVDDALAQRYSDQATDNVKYAWADVLRIDPVHETVEVRVPHEVCDGPAMRDDHRGGRDHVAATVLGAVVGGVLGNTIGKGDGRRAATVAGAVAGGAIGHGASVGPAPYAYPEARCRVVGDISTKEQLIGYDVQYRYRGDVYGSRLDYDPGDRIRVRISIEPAE